MNTLKPGCKDIRVRDTDLAGFEMKLTPAGKIVYRVDYRVYGQRRMVTIGNSSTTPEQARQMAARVLQAVAAGKDPAAEVEEKKHGVTVADLAERYLDEHAATKKKPRSATEDARLISKIISPAIGSKKALDIAPGDIGKLHHSLRNTPYQANRVLALLRKMMNLAEAWGLRELNSNPCVRIEKFKENARQRYLSADELSRLAAVMNEAEETGREPKQALCAIRLLIFTGARLNEIITAKWQYFNRDRRTLTLPDSKTGFKEIPLSEPAIDAMNNLPLVPGNDYIIPGFKRGAHFIGIQDVWERIRKAAGINDVRIHDLRHTFGSYGATANISLKIIGGVLGHTSASTTQRYAHLQSDPLHDAAETIGERLDRAMKTQPQRLRAVG